MKISIILLILNYFLASEKVPTAKMRFIFNNERPEMISQENEPTYYKLSSDTELTSAEFQEMKEILLKAINQHNKLSYHNTDFNISPLINYGVQYKAMITQEGEKEIWINGFCKDLGTMRSNADLTSTPVMVFDGGSCYFNTIIKLKKHKANKITIHGFA